MSSREPELNFVDKLWEGANRLRGKMEASQYKHKSFTGIGQLQDLNH